jgi:mannose-6-phosphate isomerase-like protein (cupin superfamily)
MIRTFTAAIVLAVIGTPVALGGQQSPGAPPATYVSTSELMEVLEKASDRSGSDTTAQTVAAGPNNVLVNIGHRTKAGATMVGVAHSNLTEIYHVIEGAGTIVTGGTFANPEPAGANTRGTIQNGRRQRITVGDVVVIPVGTPHTFSDIESTVVFLNVRINPQ